HGSAPALAGKDVANPIGAIASAAMLLRYGLALAEPAAAVEQAIAAALEQGARTRDIARPSDRMIGTREMGAWIAELVRPPEKRPSVMSPTLSPSPAPMIAEVGESISRMPGPPLGPSYRITTMSPGLMRPARIAASESSSQSNTRAGPVIFTCLIPVIFATAPSDARLPRSTARCPCAYSGRPHGRITS